MRTSFLIPVLLMGLVGCSSPADETIAPGGDTSSVDETAAPSPDSSSAEAISVTVADFMIDPSDIEASGPTVSFEVINDGPTPHNFTIRTDAGEVVMATADLGAGESETISAELEPGTYTIFCSLAGHESLGMSGTLTVVAGS